MSDPRTIFLWGMTGVGKSAVGPLLADRLGVPCADLDARIAAQAGRSITGIFAGEGELGFRRREAAALAAVCAAPRAQVIVLGGGALVNPEQRQLARRAGLIVGLTARLTTLAERLAGATDRPLLDGPSALDRLTALYTARAAAYADVDLSVATDGLQPIAVAEQILTRLPREAAA